MAALSLAATFDAALAVEIGFQPMTAEAPPMRRLMLDPDRPRDAPTAQLIEVVGIQDDSDSALRVAIKAYNASVRAYGLSDPRRIVPLTNLATARLRAGQPAAAIRDFQSAIELVPVEKSPRDPRLAEAHYGLGAAYFAQGQWPQAIKAFEDGLQQHRVYHGLSSEGQIDFLRALAASNREFGKVRDADQWQQRRVDVAERVFDRNADRMAWSYVSAGRWFRDSGNVEDALTLHGRAVSVIEAAHGTSTPLLIGPLLDLAISGAFVKPKSGSAPLPPNLSPDWVLSRAKTLALANPGAASAEGARLLERVADVYWVFGRSSDALPLYARAKSVDLSVPAFLVFHPPIPAADAPLPRGYVLAEFEVDARGKARNVALVEGIPPYLSATLGTKLLAAIRSAKLRPRMLDGKPVATAGVRYRIQVPTGDDRSSPVTSVAAKGSREADAGMRPG
ncbi:MAG: tetratricopeptide repeat protein [Panacagrimonas sp.]